MLTKVPEQVWASALDAGAELPITDLDRLWVTALATKTRTGQPGAQPADLELRHRRRAWSAPVVVDT